VIVATYHYDPRAPMNENMSKPIASGPGIVGSIEMG
jgi:hypothetical protein